MAAGVLRARCGRAESASAHCQRIRIPESRLRALAAHSFRLPREPCAPAASEALRTTRASAPRRERQLKAAGVAGG